ncbi:MAG: CheB methylesterase domain-containing protein [Myxococcota bacterium]|nr:CheB methylesterase domain-containing protein [Myxococcota bacterium]
MSQSILVINEDPKTSFYMENILSRNPEWSVQLFHTLSMAEERLLDQEMAVVLLACSVVSNELCSRITSRWPQACLIVLHPLDGEGPPQIPNENIPNLSFSFVDGGQFKNWLLRVLYPKIEEVILHHGMTSHVPSIDAHSHVIVIASSCGGPVVLRQLISTLPSTLHTPIVIAQHVPKIFDVSLCESLNAIGERRVVLAEHLAPLCEDTIYLAPFDYHVELSHNQGVFLTLNQQPHEHFLRPAADPLFRSAAALFRERCIGVILSGMGSDGVEGAKKIKELGGKVICQDKDTSIVWGMPAMAVKADVQDWVLPIDKVGARLLSLVSML